MANDIRRLRQQSIMGGYDNLTPELNQDYMSMSAPSYESEDGPWNSAPPSYIDPRDQGNDPWYGGQSQPSAGPPAPITPPSVNTYDPDRANKEMMSAIGKVFTPEHIDRDRLRSHMDAAPERERPSFARALVAGALSQKAQDPIATSEAVMYAPHRRNMADWTAKNEPFYKTAELENRENVNERTLAGNVVKSVSDDRRLEQQRIRDEGKQQVAEEKNRIGEIHARAAEARANRWETKIDGDHVIATSPDGQTMRVIGSSRGMSKEDEIKLRGAYSIGAAREYGSAAAARNEAAGKETRVDSEGNTWILSTRSVPPTATRVEGLPSGTRPETGRSGASGGGMLERERVEQDKLRDIKESNIDSSKYVKKDGNKYSMVPRPKIREDSYWPGNQAVTQADVDAWDAVKREVDPSYVPPRPAVKSGAAPAAPKESFPEININKPPAVSPQSTKGLGPQNVPSGGERIEVNKIAPQNMRKVVNGKTVAISVDGGKTWKTR